MNDLNLKIIGEVASLRDDLSIDINKPIDLYELMDKLVIDIIEISLPKGVYGACKAFGRKRLFAIDQGISYENQKRFIISHEIGHLLLHYSTYTYVCNKNYFDIWQPQKRFDKELEANSFASELLLPNKYLKELFRKQDLTMSIIESIADQFKTTLSSAAIASVNSYNDDVIIVSHKDGVKLWSYNSDSCYFPANKEINIKSLRGTTTANSWVDVEDDDLMCDYETSYFKNIEQSLTLLKLYKE
jgi:Zn-dependent peptidase ImmA (M78 family)